MLISDFPSRYEPAYCWSEDPANTHSSLDHRSAGTLATGVPGANGIAFDRQGNAWVSDGNAAQGRVWKITGPGDNCAPASLINCTEAFRIQPMRNSTSLGGAITGDGVGRQVREFPPGTLAITTGTLPVTLAGGQDLIANGVAFDRQGNLLVIDTARGTLWKVTFDERGTIASLRGCDATFVDVALCLSNVAKQHPTPYSRRRGRHCVGRGGKHLDLGQ